MPLKIPSNSDHSMFLYHPKLTNCLKFQERSDMPGSTLILYTSAWFKLNAHIAEERALAACALLSGQETTAQTQKSSRSIQFYTEVCVHFLYFCVWIHLTQRVKRKVSTEHRSPVAGSIHILIVTTCTTHP